MNAAGGTGVLPPSRRPDQKTGDGSGRDAQRIVIPVAPAGGGASEFERVVLPHLDAAYNLSRRLLKEQSMAQDVAQDAMMRALTYFPSYRGGDARAWLLRIVRNTAYSALASRRRAAEESLDSADPEDDNLPGLDLPDPGDSPETALSRQEDAGRLDRALDRLPVELRECLILREIEEMSYKDIARITGVRIGTVMSRLWRARQALLKTETGGTRP